jgi:hypothetical protein
MKHSRSAALLVLVLAARVPRPVVVPPPPPPPAPVVEETTGGSGMRRRRECFQPTTALSVNVSPGSRISLAGTTTVGLASTRPARTRTPPEPE